jgi:hypothetical protein
MLRLHRIRSVLRRQDGISLIMAIGVLGVLSMSGVTVVYSANTNARSAAYSMENGSAYDLAEAGLNEMMAILSKPQNNALNGNLLPQTTREYAGGTVTWSGTLDVAAGRWSVTSTGRTRNPTGTANDVVRTLSARVPITLNRSQPVNNPVWNFLMALRTGNSCDMTLQSSVVISAPLFVEGNLCLDSSSRITGGPLIVRNQLKNLNSSTSVGSSSSPVNEVHVVNGCKWMSNAVQNPCRNGAAPTNSNVWATVLDSDPMSVVVPQVDFAGWYDAAIPGPKMNCTAADGARTGTPPTFENETVNPTRNNSVPGVFNLTPSSSYTCRVGPATSPFGEISYNASTRTLTVAGTIFIDGSAWVNSSNAINYDGQATLYLSGTFLMTGSGQLCGVVTNNACNNAAWNPNTEMLTIVANGSGTSGSEVGAGNSIALKSSTRFQGGLWGTNAIWIDSSVQTAGPMVGSTLVITSSVQASPWATISAMPTGVPGNPEAYAQPNPPEFFSG